MNIKTRDLILTALFAALTAVGAFLHFPLGITSVTLQFLFTALSGVLLGAKYGALSQAVYVLLGLVGLPVFTQGGGLGYLVMPSMGFLFGLIPAALVIGLLTKKGVTPLRVAGACLAGLAVLYLIGLPYMYVVLNLYMGKGLSLGAILKLGCLVYLPGDAVKIAVTAVVSQPLSKALRRSAASAA